MDVSKEEKSRRRPRGSCIKVWVTAAERQTIIDRASASGLSHSSFLRALGLNTPVNHQKKANYEQFRELMKVNGDLGRVGGLLKLWLVSKRGEGASAVDVQALMREFQQLKIKMSLAMDRVND